MAKVFSQVHNVFILIVTVLISPENEKNCKKNLFLEHSIGIAEN